MEETQQLAMRPEAGTDTVDNLVAKVKRGQVRIPDFQRPLRWEAPQVLALFDSIYKGYPIGSLLLQKRSADAATVRIGPLTVTAPATHDALWVIDGQQRLTSLAAGLARLAPFPTMPDDPFVVYFDALTTHFATPPRSGTLPSTWVPVAQLLDASSLIEWVFNWQHGQDPALRTAVFEAGTRLRQYQVPLYTIETSDQTVLRDIFYRINTSGKMMNWADVHTALFSGQGEYPSTLSELADELAAKGMGRATESQLLTCMVGFAGLDPSRDISEHYRKEPDALRHAVHDSLPVIERVFDFLRNEAGIPHLSFLPTARPLVVLTRYFHLFPQPNYRSLQLLVRWAWRVFLGTSLVDERTLVRRGVGMLQAGSAEEQAQALLRLVPNVLPEQLQFALPDRFNAHAANGRLALLGLYTFAPIQADGEPIELDALVEARESGGFRRIILTGKGSNSLTSSAANRILLPDGPLSVRQELLKQPYAQASAFFASHGISAAAWQALNEGDPTGFLHLRHGLLEEAVRQMGNRLAAWGQSDRVSLDQLIAAEPDAV